MQAASTVRLIVVLCIAGLACSLGLAPLAGGDQPVPGSTESLTISASAPRQIGKPMSVTVGGTADGLHRLFVYGEAEHNCMPWPDEESKQPEAVWLTSPDGEPLAAGHFLETYTVTPELAPSYDVCAYLDTAPSDVRDDFDLGCFSLPEGECYFSSLEPWVYLAAEEHARIAVERAQAEVARRAEAEQAASRVLAETLAREAAEAAARRQAIEAKEALVLAAALKPCKVPQLHHHTLAAVRRLLQVADCRLGRVTSARRRRGPLVVASQHPTHGGTLAHDAAVSVELAPRGG